MKNSNRLHPLVITAILLSAFYWSYLGLTSQTLMVHDSLSYKNFGTMLLEDGWKEYLTTGPNREPLYPLLVALSMWIARLQNINYLDVQILIQIAILLWTQFALAQAIKRLHISDGISIAVTAYIGFSPALVNSGLVLFSEILTYPLVLWLVKRAADALRDISSAKTHQTVFNAVLLSAACLLMTFTKGVFEVLSPLLLLPYIVLLIRAVAAKDKTVIRRVCFFICIFLIAFETPLIAYKTLNKKYNGIYALTNRGPAALYGNTARRMETLDSLRVKTAVASTSGSDNCYRLYGEACTHWEFGRSDFLASEKMIELQKQGLTPQQMDQASKRESINEIFKNPFQYAFLAVLEGSKLFFWESPQMYGMVLPDAIDAFYKMVWLGYPLRFLMAAVSLLAVLYAMAHILKIRRSFFAFIDEKIAVETNIILILGAYTGLHSFFYILPRYALPLAPLYLILIALLAQNLVNQFNKKRHS